jgi:hypothetical protein
MELAGGRPSEGIAEGYLSLKPTSPTESQPSWEELKKELQAYPTIPRALFFEESPLVDGVAYLSWDGNRWQLEAEMAEDGWVEEFLEWGALVRDHQVAFPSYASKHILRPGKCFEIDFKDCQLNYVPHWSVGDCWGEEYEHQVSFQYTSEDYQAYRGETVGELIKKASKDQERFVMMEDQMGHDCLKLCGETPEDEKILQALQRGLPLYKGKRIRKASRREILKEGWVKAQGATYVDPLRKYFLSLSLKGAKALAKKGEHSFTFRSTTRAPRGSKPDREEFYVRFQEELERTHPEMVNVPSAVFEQLKRKITIKSTLQHGRLSVPHEGPFSERGRLRLSSDNIQDPLLTLQTLGMASQLSDRVPYQTLYGSRGHYRGKLTVDHPEFIQGTSMRLPRGKMVLHGMTGAAPSPFAEEEIAPDEPIKRLEAVCRSGGLLSIAERRGRGVEVQSMSPIGDIASGIDQGVSATIDSQPTYGDDIIFVLRPSVLARRDIWFAPCDYGASSRRYEQYSAYAEKIGQGKIYRPPSTRARKRHLQDGIKESSNEVYLKHSVGLEEMQAILVSEQLYPKAQQLQASLAEEGISVPEVYLIKEEDTDTDHPTVAEKVRECSEQSGGWISHTPARSPSG